MAIHIWTAKQLDEIRHNTYGPDDRYIGGEYRQMADIDCAEYGPMDPIGMSDGGRTEVDTFTYWHDRIFTGTYDGNGFRIKNWHNNTYIADVWTGSNFPIWGLGLFARSNGILKNIIMQNCSIVGLASYMHGSPWGGAGYFPIDWSCGALVGHLHGGHVYNCSSSGLVRTPIGFWQVGTSFYYLWSWGMANGGIGGLIGWAKGDMSNVLVEKCFSECEVFVEYQFTDLYGVPGIGGLIGKNLWGFGFGGSTGDDSRPTELHDVTLKNIYAMGDVNSLIQAGGVGGLAGTARHAEGKLAYVEHGYSKGLVTTPQAIFGGIGGGLIGRVWDSENITNNCYYDFETSNRNDTGKGIPRSTEDMTYPYNKNNTYINWDFSNVWEIDPEINLAYPFFGEGLGGIYVRKKEKWKDVRLAWVRKKEQWKPIEKAYPKKKTWHQTSKKTAFQYQPHDLAVAQTIQENQLKMKPKIRTAINMGADMESIKKVIVSPSNM